MSINNNNNYNNNNKTSKQTKMRANHSCACNEPAVLGMGEGNLVQDTQQRRWGEVSRDHRVWVLSAFPVSYVSMLLCTWALVSTSARWAVCLYLSFTRHFTRISLTKPVKTCQSTLVLGRPQVTACSPPRDLPVALCPKEGMPLSLALCRTPFFLS